MCANFCKVTLYYTLYQRQSYYASHRLSCTIIPIPFVVYYWVLDNYLMSDKRTKLILKPVNFPYKYSHEWENELLIVCAVNIFMFHIKDATRF